MAKSLAILKYMIMFDPAEAWATGYEFENQFADFFAAHGFEAQILEVKGGSSERVISVVRIDSLLAVTQDNNPEKTEKVMQQIKHAQSAPTKNYKQYQEGGLPKEAQINRRITKAEEQFKKGQFLPRKGYVKR